MAAGRRPAILLVRPLASKRGVPIWEQMEDALGEANSCAVFGCGPIKGWQNEQMRVAIQTHVEDEPSYLIIPARLPGTTGPE